MTLAFDSSEPRIAGKLGRQAARIPVALGWLSKYATLPAGPDEVQRPAFASYGWGMCGNDRLGDCTFAAWVHAVEAISLLSGDPVEQPSDDSVGQAYLTFTHGQDSGAVEAEVLATAHSVGILGHTLDAYAPRNGGLAELESIVAIFGVAYLGVTLTQSDMDAFGSGEPWTLGSDNRMIGGHAIPVVEYDRPGRMAKVVTWGREQLVTYEWLAARTDETWAIIPDDAAPGLNGLDLAQLEADLELLHGAVV